MNHGKIEQIGSRRRQCRGMYELLQEYTHAGIRICLEGKEAEPGQIAATCLREGVSYMMDFIPEGHDSQKITRINFNRIDQTDRSESSPPVPYRRKGTGHGQDPPDNPGWCG